MCTLTCIFCRQSFFFTVQLKSIQTVKQALERLRVGKRLNRSGYVNLETPWCKTRLFLLPVNE